MVLIKSYWYWIGKIGSKHNYLIKTVIISNKNMKELITEYRRENIR